MRFCYIFYFLLSTFLIHAQTIENGNFEQKDSTEFIARGWKPVTYGAYSITRYADPSRNGSHVMRIEKTGDGNAAMLSQNISYTAKQDAVFLFTGMLKTKDIKDGRAYFFIQGFDEKGYRVMRTIKERSFTSGTHDWQPFSARFFLPALTFNIVIGCALEGDGIAWFDNLNIQKIPTDVSQTAIAKNYITEVTDSISKRYLYKDSVDMNRIRTIAYAMTANAKTTSDCYDAVWAALFNLGGDHHSRFMTPEEAKNYSSQEASKVDMPTGKLLDNKIAYLTVPAFLSMNRVYMKQYVDSMHALLRKLDVQGNAGWIIDVRNNIGGSNIPMLAGIGPLAGEGMISGYKDFAGNIGGNYYRLGTSYASENGKDTIIYKNEHPYSLRQSQPYIAVLMNGRCGSSGESVVLSFLNRPKTKTFGEQTAGLTTGNGFVTLSDGAVLALTEGIGVDRKGIAHPGKIKPDVMVADDPTTKNDEVIDAALKWLEEVNR